MSQFKQRLVNTLYGEKFHKQSTSDFKSPDRAPGQKSDTNFYAHTEGRKNFAQIRARKLVRPSTAKKPVGPVVNNLFVAGPLDTLDIQSAKKLVLGCTI